VNLHDANLFMGSSSARNQPLARTGAEKRGSGGGSGVKLTFGRLLLLLVDAPGQACAAGRASVSLQAAGTGMEALWLRLRLRLRRSWQQGNGNVGAFHVPGTSFRIAEREHGGMPDPGGAPERRPGRGARHQGRTEEAGTESEASGKNLRLRALLFQCRRAREKRGGGRRAQEKRGRRPAPVRWR
jgi:hypothetical protein